MLHKYIEERRKGLRSEVLYDGVVNDDIPPGATHPFEHISTETQLKHVAGHYGASGLVPASGGFAAKLKAFVDAMLSSDAEGHGARGSLPELEDEQTLGQGKDRVHWSAEYDAWDVKTSKAKRFDKKKKLVTETTVRLYTLEEVPEGVLPGPVPPPGSDGWQSRMACEAFKKAAPSRHGGPHPPLTPS